MIQEMQQAILDPELRGTSPPGSPEGYPSATGSFERLATPMMEIICFELLP
jgi:hypothetical protein